jgi:putative glutamine amidotransferase
VTPPRIAIAHCSKLPDYEAAVRNAGGAPHVIDRDHDRPEDVVRQSAGLVLSGGGDVTPSIYGAVAHPTFSAAEPGRDEFELALARLALEADVPILAICRGIQVLNVSRGGDLVQDIPDELRSPVSHRVPVPGDAIAHAIRVEPGSLLARLMAERLSADGTLPVNSRHHQALKRVGTGLSVTARATDGVIEAVEDVSKRFCLGVQWHPENFWRTGEFRAVFEGFVNACLPRT